MKPILANRNISMTTKIRSKRASLKTNGNDQNDSSKISLLADCLRLLWNPTAHKTRGSSTTEDPTAGQWGPTVAT
ncbi:hypothetical protein PoB_000117000 [Plakobranchus ocellatus]|uniref:Uncharacterized protein n=1 Tax=Plakobranchus ocellatus TaxID=259542 RepID=A0AAV3XW79_9GAST|nr:hypothetical protein PoB_000117000 [Plakobranchus ocellatus]